MRQDMPIHEREKTFEIDSEDGPWVSKGLDWREQGRKEDQMLGVLDAPHACCQWLVPSG